MSNNITRGARALRAVVDPRRAMTQKKMAEALGVTQQAVSSWLHGLTSPRKDARADLERVAGIPISAWDEPTSDESGPLPAVEADEAETG